MDQEENNRSPRVLLTNHLPQHFYYNARSIFEYDRRTSFSNAITAANHYQIVCLTETWLNESVKDSATFLAKFTIHRKDRPSAKGAKKHGGALIAVARNISGCEIVSSFKECVVIRLLMNKPIIICCLYSAPRNSHYTWSFADFTQLLTVLRSKQYEYGAVCSYIAGDINLTCTHWPSMTSTSSDEQIILNELCDLNFQQLIRSQDGKLLDIFLCNKPRLFQALFMTIILEACSEAIICRFMPRSSLLSSYHAHNRHNQGRSSSLEPLHIGKLIGTR